MEFQVSELKGLIHAYTFLHLVNRGVGMLPFPIVCELLRFENLCGGHLALNVSDILVDTSQGKPQVRQDVVFWNSKTCHVEDAQIVSPLSRSA